MGAHSLLRIMDSYLRAEETSNLKSSNNYRRRRRRADVIGHISKHTRLLRKTGFSADREICRFNVSKNNFLGG